MPWGGERQGGVAWETRCCVWRGEGGVPQSPLPQGGRAPLGSPSLYVCSQVGPVALRA